MEHNTTIIEHCPLCGASFTCTPSDCWCSKLPPVMPVNSEGKCYCPACLNNMIQQQTESQKKDKKQGSI